MEEIRIECLNFGRNHKRILNVLLKCGFKYTGDFMYQTPMQLFRYKNLGRMCINGIKTALEERGLVTRTSLYWPIVETELEKMHVMCLRDSLYGTLYSGREKEKK